MLARTQATDTEILAALRCEFCACRPSELPPSELAKSFARWAADIEDARAAGRLEVLEALQATAADSKAPARVTAAVYLAKANEANVPREVARELVRLEGMSPAERAAYVAELGARMGAG